MLSPDASARHGASYRPLVRSFAYRAVFLGVSTDDEVFSNDWFG